MRKLFFSIVIYITAPIAAFAQQNNNVKPNTYCFEGKINSTIPVFLTFVIKDSIALGRIIYTKTKAAAPIKLIGVVSADNIKLNEFSNDGHITGILFGNIKNQSFSGTWFSPKTRHDMPFDLKNKDTVIKTLVPDIQTKDIAGTYTYSYGKSGAQGSLKVNQKNKSQVSIIFFNVTDAPGRNTAELKLDNLNLNRNEVIGKVEDAASCMFRIRFFKNFVVVDYVNEQRDCSFGNNADIDGVYLKTSK